MKVIIIALFILIATTSIQQAAFCSPDFNGMKPWSSSSNVNSKDIEAKIADALQGLGAMQKESSLNNFAANSLSSVNSAAINNSTAINSTAVNSTKINTTAINATARDGDSVEAEGGSGAMSLSGSSSISPQGVASDSKASFRGFWGMEANQKKIGKNGINSKTFLSGDFEVDKTVSFQDRGY